MSRRVDAIEALQKGGFESWKDRAIYRQLLLDAPMLASPDLQEQVIEFAADSFRQIAASGILALDPTAPVADQPNDG